MVFRNGTTLKVGEKGILGVEKLQTCGFYMTYRLNILTLLSINFLRLDHAAAKHKIYIYIFHFSLVVKISLDSTVTIK